MKKKILLFVLSMILLLGSTMNVAATFNRSYTAHKGTPTIDGEIDDVWSTAEWTPVDELWDTAQDPDSDGVCYIKVLWDESHLYFLANVYDSTENERNDLIEIYIDQNKSAKAEYEDDDSHTRFYLRKNGVRQNSGKNCQGDAPSVSKSLGDNKFIVEGQLEWKGGKASVGHKMGLEFMYNDGSMFRPFTEAYRWNADTKNGDDYPYESTKHFGTLTLADVGTADEKNNTLPAEAPERDTVGVTVNRGDDDTQNAGASAPDEEEQVTPSDTENTKNDKTNEKGTSGAGWVIPVTIAVVVVVIAVVVILIIRKKKAK